MTVRMRLVVLASLLFVSIAEREAPAAQHPEHRVAVERARRRHVDDHLSPRTLRLALRFVAARLPTR